MTETEIIKILARSIDDREYPFQIPNAFMYAWESDYWVLSARGQTKEFEIKCSFADFKKDAKKDKHKECTGANFFYYVCPDGVIPIDEVPSKYGLMYVYDERYAAIVKRPRKLHDNKFENWRLLAVKMYYRWHNLWKEKYIIGTISDDEYRQGFNISLLKDENEN